MLSFATESSRINPFPPRGRGRIDSPSQRYYPLSVTAHEPQPDRYCCTHPALRYFIIKFDRYALLIDILLNVCGMQARVQHHPHDKKKRKKKHITNFRQSLCPVTMVWIFGDEPTWEHEKKTYHTPVAPRMKTHAGLLHIETLPPPLPEDSIGNWKK